MVNKIRKYVVIFFIVIISISGCYSKQNANKDVFKFKINEDKEFSTVNIISSNEEFEKTGLKYGDSVDIKFSNGYTLTNIPYYNGFYERVNKPILVNYSGQYIAVAFCSGDSMWKAANCKDGDTVEITIHEKGKFLNTQQALATVYTDNRDDYKSDEAFSNFRPMVAGKLKKNTIYRGASPVDNSRKRAAISDSLLSKNKIAYILDLADTQIKLKKYFDKKDFNSPYSKKLYEDGKLYTVGLTASFRSNKFKQKLADGLRDMMTHDGPYYIHCTEGKDRTGFVCMLIGALCDATFDELEYDYMVTYDNYCGISKAANKEKYDAVKTVKFLDMIWWLENVPDNTDLTNYDLSKGARDYLLSAGMTDEEINKLIEILCK